MIPKVPMAWKTIPWDGSLAIIIGAEEGFIAVSMHGMGFTLMAEKASRG